MKIPLLLALLFSLTACFAQRETNMLNTGFRFPDEWDIHEGTILIFPAQHSYGRTVNALQGEFAALANSIQQNEQVIVFAHSNDANRAAKLLDEDIDIHVGDDYRIDWARDNAPMIVRNSNGERRAVCFQFNGWGGKYDGWEADIGVNAAIAKELGFQIVHSDLVLEGGAIEIGSSEKGQIGIVTKQCVLNRNRTDWSKERVEHELMEKLGLQHIIWIDRGLDPDPMTDGHVDGLLKFIDRGTVLLHTTDDKEDSNYQICQDAKQRLESAGLVVIELPLAWDIVHMNFFIGSGGDVVYVPVCGDPDQDKPALAILGRLFEEVIPIDANAMAKAGGGVHCYTQQIPAGN